MSENLNRDFSKYEAMTTEELEEILRLDAEAPEGAETDTELLLYILEVLASREDTNDITGNCAQKAWESFQQNYMPEEARRSVKRKKPVVWMRRLVAAAAVAVILISIPISTKALTLGEVWDIFARWAKETFSFVCGEDTGVSEPSPDDEYTYSSLQEMLEEHKRDASIVPTKVLDGFDLEYIEKIISPAQEIYLVRYFDGNRKYTIRVQNYLNEDFQKVEINQEYSEIYYVDEVDYYIFINYNQIQAIWLVDSYECTIAGNLSIDEIKLMIDSIGKG